MFLSKKLELGTTLTIDWEMTPDYTFGTFESWGGRERFRSSAERIYYFFIDDWGDNPRLCLMERGIKHARVMAEILAPRDMIRRCVAGHGKTSLFERSFAIDEPLKKWLIAHVIDGRDDSLIIPLEPEKPAPLAETDLPGRNAPVPELTRVCLPGEPEEMSEADVAGLAVRFNLYDSERNPTGTFANYLVDNGDNATVSDLVTGLMWQREGVDIMSSRMLLREIDRLNRNGYAGYSDWRLPTMPEALSLIGAEKNSHGQHIHDCFSPHQPFIFTAATRRPGGCWFVDYKQGKAFWSSGTIPGGFGRLCRSERTA
ncbi:MAG: DUF1566 domain-containing protein [Desulfobulbaceae bacterium]|jgi:hypothetical protein|nr:DUF1566 domain-containing protein [Desulfobulbaceae bacterium]